MQRLLQLCSEQQIVAHRSPINVYALAAGVLPAAEQGTGVLGMVDCTAAVECLRAAPDLADLQQWSQWNQVCGTAAMTSLLQDIARAWCACTTNYMSQSFLAHFHSRCGKCSHSIQCVSLVQHT